MAISPMQRMFNKMVRHIRRQGQKSVNAAGFCLYRTENKLECVVGCLIPNKLYNEDMEGQNVYGVLKKFPKVQTHFAKLYGVTLPDDFIEASRTLIYKMQGAHDDMTSVEVFNRRVAEIATNFGLTVPKVKKPRSTRYTVIKKAIRSGDSYGWYVAVRERKTNLRAFYVHSDGSLHTTTKLGRDWPGYFKTRKDARKARALAVSMGNV